MRATLNAVATTQSEKEMPKHVLRRSNPGWIQQRKKKVLTINKRTMEKSTKFMHI